MPSIEAPLAAALAVLLGGGLLAGILALWRAVWIFNRPVENARLKKISGFIAEGALAFLFKMYRVLLPIIVLAGVFIWIVNKESELQWMGASFAWGALCSALAGFIGMRVATAANARTTHAAQSGLAAGLKVSWTGGTVMGLSVAALALLGFLAVLAAGLIFFNTGSNLSTLSSKVIPIVAGYILGASTFALFARVGGGIFTKAADVGADLVGKIEAGIPEDDHRNPAVIADNVGDNVGDLAGMGADLFSSFVSVLAGAMILGLAVPVPENVKLLLGTLPLLLATLGVVASFAGMILVRVKDNGSVQKAINRGTTTAGLVAIAGAPALIWFWLSAFGDTSAFASPLGISLSVIAGVITGLLTGVLTEYFTASGKSPVNAIVRSSQTGPATNIITGMGMGMMSSLPAMFVIVVAVLCSHAFAGIYGVAMTAFGMLLTFGIQMSVSAFGPIADNAGGLSEMAEFPSSVREVTDKLDSVGNTTSATGKGFAIGSSILVAVILFAAFNNKINLTAPIQLLDIRVMAGLLLGGMIPYIFSSLNMNAIGKAAMAMIEEVRRQFREKPGILEETEEPDYKACVSIATGAAIQEMFIPGLIATFAPILVGFLGGVEMLLGLLIGVTVSGAVLGIFMSNTGGAWDNAKKSIEASGGKGSETHKAAVVGDTVGDPFKDTAGPSVNILIKLMAVVALVIAPLLINYFHLGGVQ